jgi:glycosyltransferase involved in cell wall biosynthesis
VTTGPARGGRRRKVVYVIGSLDVGGTEGQLLDLAGALDPRRFEPVILCLAEIAGLAERVSPSVRVETIPLRGLRPWQPFSLAAGAARLVQALRRERPDVVHGFLIHGYVLGALAARMARVPVVLASRRSLGHFKRGKPHYALLERLVNPLTDLLIANSEGVRTDVVRREGVRGNKVLVIHNGLDLRRFDVPPDPELARELAPARPVVAVIANLIGYKGHRFFLEAWSTVLRQSPSAVALLVGDGPLRGELEATVRHLHLGPSVRFLGTRHDVPAVLALADLVVHPSLQEGFSNAVLEGMAAGRPVVATAVGGTPEAVRHEETGLLVPPADSGALATAIGRLLADPATARAFGAAGRARVAAEFELARMARQYEALYERLVDARFARS